MKGKMKMLNLNHLSSPHLSSPYSRLKVGQQPVQPAQPVRPNPNPNLPGKKSDGGGRSGDDAIQRPAKK
jgi:hypothetical protein